MASTASMVAKDAPVLEPSDRVLDPGAASSVSAPGTVAYDAAVSKHRRYELGDAPVAAIGEHPTMLSTQLLDIGPAEVQRVVPIAGPARGRGNDPKSRRRIRICALHDHRSFFDVAARV